MDDVPERADSSVQNGGVLGWRCAVCGHTLDVAAVHPFRCPRASAADPHHVLHPLTGGPALARLDHANPFVAYGPRLAWWAFARAHGLTESACVALTEDLAAGFTVTPYTRPPELTSLHPSAPARPSAAGPDGGPSALGSPAVGPSTGGEIWVKDETGTVGGSHKARHLVTTLLHLRSAELVGAAPYGAERPPLAIASCGNAAVAAATLAARAEWPLRVFVPEWADPVVTTIVGGLGAEIIPCPRRDDDPPGDPAVLRFREAVDAGALPFGVQGPENAVCLDGGRTLGWELADAPTPPGRVLVQVGGGAFAACVGWGLGPSVQLDTVQTAGCAPLARAWRRASGLADDELGRRWHQLMTPWDAPQSAASGILDDETYDWLGDIAVMRASGGHPIVVAETDVLAAHERAQATGIRVSVTGSAGLAGLLHEPPASGERVAVVFSGIAR